MSGELERDDFAALVELHRGLPRQGPGDARFTLELLGDLPPLPARPRIADLGCGSGAGALLLAKRYQSPVRAVDRSWVFLGELEARAAEVGLAHLVEPICADMGALDWPDGSLDLLWSEGAAYNLGFEAALGAWRRLLAPDGVAVVSELTWFTEAAPEPARSFWGSTYPTLGTERENVERAREAGFRVLFTRRLPSRAWWENYYGPLRARMSRLDRTGIDERILRETEAEMSLFERYGDSYGYTFYVLASADRRASPPRAARG